jgi:hypothetical protein
MLVIWRLNNIFAGAVVHELHILIIDELRIGDDRIYQQLNGLIVQRLGAGVTHLAVYQRAEAQTGLVGCVVINNFALENVYAEAGAGLIEDFTLSDALLGCAGEQLLNENILIHFICLPR